MSDNVRDLLRNIEFLRATKEKMNLYTCIDFMSIGKYAFFLGLSLFITSIPYLIAVTNVFENMELLELISMAASCILSIFSFLFFGTLIFCFFSKEIIVYKNPEQYMAKKIGFQDILELEKMIPHLKNLKLNDLAYAVDRKISEEEDAIKTKENLTEFHYLLNSDEEFFDLYADYFTELLEDYNEENEERNEKIEKMNSELKKIGLDKIQAKERKLDLSIIEE